jgi:hypothetical protein
MPTLLFLLLFCNTFGTIGLSIVQTSFGFSGTHDLHRLVGINLVLPHRHEHYSYAWV